MAVCICTCHLGKGADVRSVHNGHDANCVSVLQGIYDSRQRCELEMAKREQEIKQLQGWKTTVQTLIERFEDLCEQSASFQRSALGTALDLRPGLLYTWLYACIRMERSGKYEVP